MYQPKIKKYYNTLFSVDKNNNIVNNTVNNNKFSKTIPKKIPIRTVRPIIQIPTKSTVGVLITSQKTINKHN